MSMEVTCSLPLPALVLMRSCYYIPHLYVKMRVLYGIFQICNVWLSLKMLC